MTLYIHRKLSLNIFSKCFKPNIKKFLPIQKQKKKKLIFKKTFNLKTKIKAKF